MQTLPNILTIGRIIAVPFFVAALLLPDPFWRWTAFVLFVAAAITDFLDGYIARKYNLTSDLGRMLDPIADKMVVAGSILGLLATGVLGWIGFWAGFVILIRELFVSGLREFMGPKNIAVPVSQLAKIKTAIELFALGLLIAVPLFADMNMGGLARDVGLAALALAAALAIWTGLGYFRAAWPHLKT